MYIIGITGASGSGKSTLAKQIEGKLEKSTLLLTLDMYYKNNSNMSKEERAHVNYDAPGAFEYDLLVSDIEKLQNREPIELKEYDFVEHLRRVTGSYVEAPDILIIEGIHTLYNEKIRKLLDLKVYIQVDADICILRRLHRDIVERGRTIDSVIEQYTKTVKPMYEKYIRNYMELADIVMPNAYKNPKAVDIIKDYVNKTTRDINLSI